MESKHSNPETLQNDVFDHEYLTVIEPAKGWRALDFKELWAYRELFWVLTLRDIKVRYKQTVLGVVWAVLQPVLTMFIFTIVFGGLAKIPSDGYPYAIFVFAALLPWTFFANAVSTSSTSLITASNMVSKVYFPRLIIPLSSIGSGLVDLAISTLVLFALMIWFGVGWSLNLLLIPVLLAAVIFTALGVGTLLSALTVAYRDFRFVVPFMVQIWMYATPVVYPVSLVPEKWQWLLFLNPMTGVIEAFRSAFLDRPFDLPSIGISLLMSMVIFIVGVAYFERVERRFADII
ncbi:MAG: ABC transporter permease [Zetaproteobacteria bacterium]|nr:ABC transporter permease [Zetaproteobacteria bacterium]